MPGQFILTGSAVPADNPSIATAVLRVNPETVLSDFELFGFLFESLCTRDMRVYAQVNDGDLFHYRDKSELEVDLIVRLRDGRWSVCLSTSRRSMDCPHRLPEGVIVTMQEPGAPEPLSVRSII